MLNAIRRFPLMIATMFPVLALADNVAGVERMLCSLTQVRICDEFGDCETGPTWSYNMPSFIQVDLKAKMLSTTPASDEVRRTPITHQVRDQGRIVVQGVENGRAFSLVIAEADGLATAALALDGYTISAFGACTPAA